MAPPPQVFSDRYEMVRHIARGGMAQVYLARDLLLDRPVALKVLFPELSVDPSFVERFRAEAKAAANLSHPNIVAVFDWGQGEQTYFIVMEYVDGTTLSAQIRSAPLPAARAAAIGADVAAALEFAHRRGVIHRDVKPGNVLLDRAGQVKVADFGIARAVGATEGLTQTGAVMGTATYFSPEQAQGLAVDARSDVYSLGVVLYEMVAGRAPFTGDNPVTIAYKHVGEQPPPMATLRPDVPAAYAAVVAKAMAKDPAGRYATAADLRADLLRFSAGQPVLAAAAVDPTMVGATRVVPVNPYEAAGATGVLAAPEAARRRDPTAAVAADAARSRRSLAVLAALGVLVLAGVLLATVGRSLLGSPTATGTVIPADIIGVPAASAQGELRGLGFTHVSTTPAVSDTVGAGDVVSSNPVPGTRAATSAAVVLTVSSGATPVAVPNVVGQAQAAATTSLQAAGFKVALGQAQSSSSVAQGAVISTTPAPGASAPKGSTVELVVSSGQQTVAIPPLAGVDSSTASNKLGQLGLNVTTRMETSTTVAPGRVTRTTPAAGSNVAVGSTVTLFVSQGTAVPNVDGDTLATAQSSLAAAGLTSKVNRVVVTDPGQDGVVLDQTPAGGSNVAPGSAVTLVVGSYTAAATTTTTVAPVVTIPTASTTTTSLPG